MIELSNPPESKCPDHAPPPGALPDAPELPASVQDAASPLYRSDFLERYRLWKGLERLRSERAAGNADVETIAREEQTRAEWLTPETAMDLLVSDLQSGQIQRQYLDHNARRLGLDPSDVRATIERQAAEEREREREGQDRSAEVFEGTLLAFDPGDSTGWALLRLASADDIQKGRAEREREPLLLAAGAFLVEAPAGEGWSDAHAETESLRAQMLAALASLSSEARASPRLPELARRGVRGGQRWETRRSEPGEACAALIRELRPSIVVCEWIYRVFPKGKRVETSEGPIMKSGMSVAMTTGLYRAGAIGGAIRTASLAAGVPFAHCSAAAWRRSIVGSYRAKDREVAAVIARVRRAPLQAGGSLSTSTSHARDAVGVALFALASLRPAEQAREGSGEAPTVEAHPSPTGSEPAPARRRPGRPRKVLDPSAPPPIKRPRGRPRKVPLDASTGTPWPSSEPASLEPGQPALSHLDPVSGSKPGNAP